LRLVCGLGNPEVQYEATRHNIGERVLRFLAFAHGVPLKKEHKLFGKIAKIRIGDEEILLLFPTTYMNESGRAVSACSRFFRILPQDILVIADDVELPFGKIRLRAKGSHGGHNGLRSVQTHLGTDEYPKMRIGIGSKQEGQDLSDYVLERFTEDEEAQLYSIIQSSAEVVHKWATMPIGEVMNGSNGISKKPDLLNGKPGREDKEKE